MSTIVYIATSLDGYIARKDGNLDWLMEIPNPGKSDFGFAAFLNRIDGIIMGRKTFEAVLSFHEWPYFKPVFVLSSTLKKVPDNLRDKAEIVTGKLKTILTSLKDRGCNNLYIDGGQTIRSFLKQDLIDEFIITKVPVILGSGIPLFTDMPLEIKFAHIETEIFNNTLVKSRYVRIE
ncbi:MAG: dihydrofolate reductase [Spirochaetales bacterium]|nr:dihydrofolate reductase [Spirochaetales bacterium]